MLCRRDTLSGAVLEIEQYTAADNVLNIKTATPKEVKPKTPEEKEEHNRHKSEKHFIRVVNANFNAHAYYVTLTYDNEHLPESYADAQKQLRLYVRRLKYRCPKAKIIGVTGYGTRSGRLHHHLIIDGVNEEDILSKWIGGELVRAEHLKQNNIYNGVDHGEDYTGLAVYLHAHTNCVTNGKRWVQTKTVEMPDEKPVKEIKRAYSEDKPPKAPKGYMYIGVTSCPYFASTYINFKYVRIPAKSLQIESHAQYHKKS